MCCMLQTHHCDCLLMFFSGAFAVQLWRPFHQAGSHCCRHCQPLCAPHPLHNLVKHFCRPQIHCTSSWYMLGCVFCCQRFSALMLGHGMCRDMGCNSAAVQQRCLQERRFWPILVRLSPCLFHVRRWHPGSSPWPHLHALARHLRS
jgi:hypothetical protein